MNRSIMLVHQRSGFGAALHWANRSSGIVPIARHTTIFWNGKSWLGVSQADPPLRRLRTKIRRFKYVGNPRIYPDSRFAHALPNELSRQGDSNAARESSRCI